MPSYFRPNRHIRSRRIPMEVQINIKRNWLLKPSNSEKILTRTKLGTKIGTIRAILSIVTSQNLHLVLFDVSTALLYGYLDEVIYMKKPGGFEDGISKLFRSIYRLKQGLSIFDGPIWQLHNF